MTQSVYVKDIGADVTQIKHRTVTANIIQGVKRCAAQVDDDDDDSKGLVQMVMGMLGIDPGAVGEDDNLAGMGIDSMQAVEVRSKMQRKLGRPIPLEEASFWTLMPSVMTGCRPDVM